MTERSVVPGTIVTWSEKQGILAKDSWQGTLSGLYELLRERTEARFLCDLSLLDGQELSIEEVGAFFASHPAPRGGVFVSARLVFHLPLGLRDPSGPHAPRRRPPDLPGKTPAFLIPDAAIAGFLRTVPSSAERAQQALQELLAADSPDLRATLPSRIAHRLGAKGLSTLTDLLRKSYKELMGVRGVGVGTLGELDEWVRRRTRALGAELTWEQARTLLQQAGQPATCVATGTGSSVSRDSVSSLLGMLPAAALTLPVKALRTLPARTRNALEQHGVHELWLLSELTDPDLLRWRYFGEVSLLALKQAIADLALRLQRVKVLRSETAASLMQRLTLASSLHEQVRESLTSCDERAREILSLRTFARRAACSLAALSGRLGVSRERVRILENAAVLRVDPGGRLVSTAEEKIAGLRLGRSCPLTLRELETLDPWFEGVSAEPGILAGLLRTRGQSHVVVDELPGSPPFVTDRRAQRLQDLASLLRSRARLSDETHPAVLARSICEEVSAPELAGTILALAGETVVIGDVVRLNPGFLDRVEAVLSAAGVPLHVDEIERRLSQAGISLMSRTVQSCLDRDRVIRTAPSTYVLATKLGEWERYRGQVDEEVRSLMSADRMRQWSAKEILLTLRDKGVEWADSLPVYVMDYLLRKLPAFRDLRRGIWALASAGPGNRLSVQDTACAILEESGGHLSLKELMARIRRVRSLSRNLGINWPLVRLPDGQIANGFRTLGLSAEQFELFKASIRDALTGSGHHLSGARVRELLAAAGSSGMRVSSEVLPRLLSQVEGIRLDVDDTGDWVLRPAEAVASSDEQSPRPTVEVKA